MAFQGSGDVDVMPPMPVLALPSSYSPDIPPTDRQHDSINMIRSASFTSLPQLSEAPRDGIKRTFSENILSLPTSQTGPLSEAIQDANAELFRRASRKAKKRMSVLVSHVDDTTASTGEKREQTDDSKNIPRTVTGTWKNFARKTWMPTRSASPLRKEEPTIENKKSRSPKKRLSYSARPIAMPAAAAIRVSSRSPKPDDEHGDYFETHRRSSPSPGARTRSLKDMGSRNASVTSFHQLSRQSSNLSLKSRSSNEGLYLGVPGGIVPPLPSSASSERLSAARQDSTRKKDPLWNAFRTIDGEFSAFQSKTSLQKVKTIRSVLLPFLSKYNENDDLDQLRAEDLDRRVHILNKWWSTILELLNGRSNQSISGTDRPAFLEAVTEIMQRPEWRVPPFPRAPHDFLKRRFSSSNSKVAHSVDSEESDFLIDSIHQNVRNMYVQNLLSQMSFVVDKLSLRSAPASLINFGGKTCAYAFFFCPGVADILVRLWHLQPGILRRIFSEYQVLHNGKGTSTPVDLASKFPPPIRSLCFSSQASLARHVQPKAQRPPGSESIRWYGPWVNRWIGRDSDLFFVFAKYYHILACQFQPVVLPRDERVCIPGLIPVHAQLLVVLESTLYRHVGHVAADPYHVGDGIEAMTPLPLSIPNATRSIAENRLVMLLRDLAGDGTTASENVSELMVTSFELLMRAATRRVSMYHSDACFVLCDLIEEVCPIVNKYEQVRSSATVLDWSFWMKVLQQMMQTHTTMTQIRVIALIYSIWTPLTAQDDRKREVILDWLLDPPFFASFFCHWSSMVRHYFLRLICWRVARCDGHATLLDEDILSTLITRLTTLWSNHQYLLAEAEMRGLCAPVSSPCSPAPGRSLIIIRTDTIASPQFSTFDKILSSNQSAPYRNHSSTLHSMPEVDTPQTNNKKRWSILRSINLFGSAPGNPRPGEVTPPMSPDSIPTEMSGSSTVNSASTSRPATPPYQSLSFRFSLEYTPARPNPLAKSRTLPLPLLPGNAHRILLELDAVNYIDVEQASSPSSVKPIKPQGENMIHARYSGRALAEWVQVVSECQNFYARRRQEGCPKDCLVETPSMAVESFRMFS